MLGVGRERIGGRKTALVSGRRGAAARHDPVLPELEERTVFGHCQRFLLGGGQARQHRHRNPTADQPLVDFGAPAVLTTLKGGQRLLVLAQKSGAVYALDPDQEGKLVWQSQVGKGGPLGGIEWGVSLDGNRLYTALADIGFRAPKAGAAFGIDPTKGGGIFALKVENGERLWMTPPPPCGDRRPCSPAQSAAVSAIPGAVFSGSLDGHIRAFSTTDGKMIWDYDTEHDYQTVNGVPAKGGSLNAGGPVVVGGMVLINSGYGQFGEAPGNVLLAFTVDGR